MKKVIFTILVFIGTSCNAQLGVLTLGPKDDFYYGQWYTRKDKEYKNMVLYYDTHDKVDSLLNVLLAPWDLTLEDGEKDDFGKLVWNVDNENGFYATIYKIDYDDNDAWIQIDLSLEEPEE